MIFYLFFLIFSLSIILLSTDRNCYSLNNDFLLVFFSIIIILVCGFRFGIGTDYGNYINIYNNLEEYPRIEKGFLCIIKISKFLRAGKPDMANELYEYFVEKVRERLGKVECGDFGADMKVELVNDGPFTIVLDSDEVIEKK